MDIDASLSTFFAPAEDQVDFSEWLCESEVGYDTPAINNYNTQQLETQISTEINAIHSPNSALSADCLKLLPCDIAPAEDLMNISRIERLPDDFVHEMNMDSLPLPNSNDFAIETEAILDPALAPTQTVQNPPKEMEFEFVNFNAKKRKRNENSPPETDFRFIMNPSVPSEYKYVFSADIPDRPTKMRKRTAKDRREMKEVAKVSPCIRCRMYRKKCSGKLPCGECQRYSQNGALWQRTCIRVDIFSEIGNETGFVLDFYLDTLGFYLDTLGFYRSHKLGIGQARAHTDNFLTAFNRHLNKPAVNHEDLKKFLVSFANGIENLHSPPCDLESLLKKLKKVIYFYPALLRRISDQFHMFTRSQLGRLEQGILYQSVSYLQFEIIFAFFTAKYSILGMRCYERPLVFIYDYLDCLLALFKSRGIPEISEFREIPEISEFRAYELSCLVDSYEKSKEPFPPRQRYKYALKYIVMRMVSTGFLTRGVRRKRKTNTFAFARAKKTFDLKNLSMLSAGKELLVALCLCPKLSPLSM